MGRTVLGMVMEEMTASYCRWFVGRRIRQRTHAGECIFDVLRRKFRFRKQTGHSAKQISDLFARGCGAARVGGIWNFGGADQHLLVPGQNEDWAAICGLGVKR